MGIWPTQMAANTGEFIKHLAYPDISWKPEDAGLELVQGFDRSRCLTLRKIVENKYSMP